MQTHKAKRVEITIETVMQSRIVDVLNASGVTGYTVLPVLGGSGRSGEWDRSGQVSRAAGMVCFVCIVGEDRVDPLLEATYAIIDKHMGVISVSDCEIIRRDRF